MIEVRVKPIGFDVLIQKWRRKQGQIKRDTDRINRKYANVFLKVLEDNASGRPGPRKITGQYLDSWTIETKGRGRSISRHITTQHPAAKRLEYGFVGTDSLGRVYNQPPYPHVRRTAAEVGPMYITACRNLNRSWFFKRWARMEPG